MLEKGMLTWSIVYEMEWFYLAGMTEDDSSKNNLRFLKQKAPTLVLEDALASFLISLSSSLIVNIILNVDYV